MSSQEILETLKLKLPILDIYHIADLALFGSCANGTEKTDSDVDVLVDFEEGQDTFDNYMDLKFTLEDLFQRKVDLVISDSIKPALKAAILGSALYVKRA